MIIGKIVKSDSHITYTCQIYSPHEVERKPTAADYAFGRFVRATVHPSSPARDEVPEISIVGIIYDTLLLNPSFGALGPRLSNQGQIELFSPDYLVEKAVMTSILLLGTLERQRSEQDVREQYTATQGIPLFSLDLGSEIETMTEEEIRAFHFFAHAGTPASLHMEYLPHLLAQRNSLLPLVALQLIEHVEHLFPEHIAMLSIVKRNVAWRLKVETTG